MVLDMLIAEVSTFERSLMESTRNEWASIDGKTVMLLDIGTVAALRMAASAAKKSL